MEHNNPKLTVDAVILDGDSVVLIKRKNEPFKGEWALPGGFVDAGERVEDAVMREALEETSLVVRITGLMGVYSDPGRDPRGHTVSVVFLCEKIGGSLNACDDASAIELFKLEELPVLAFDHNLILKDTRSFLKSHDK